MSALSLLLVLSRWLSELRLSSAFWLSTSPELADLLGRCRVSKHTLPWSIDPTGGRLGLLPRAPSFFSAFQLSLSPTNCLALLAQSFYISSGACPVRAKDVFSLRACELTSFLDPVQPKVTQKLLELPILESRSSSFRRIDARARNPCKKSHNRTQNESRERKISVYETLKDFITSGKRGPKLPGTKCLFKRDPCPEMFPQR